MLLQLALVSTTGVCVSAPHVIAVTDIQRDDGASINSPDAALVLMDARCKLSGGQLLPSVFESLLKQCKSK